MLRLFSLDERLRLCADMVKDKDGFVDVGTDHAYLPIWLLKKNIITDAVVVDINEKPLKNAKKNIERHNVSDRVKLILSDGLEKVSPDDVKTVVIAGMGAETICSIISKTVWLKNKHIHLILQPMSSDEVLRRFLISEQFEVEREEVVLSMHRLYSVMSVYFSGNNMIVDDVFPYIGKICCQAPKNPDYKCHVIRYIDREIKNLKNRLKGLAHRGYTNDYERLSHDILKLEKERERYNEYNL